MFISLTTMDKDLLLINVYGPNSDNYMSFMIIWRIMSMRWNIIDIISGKTLVFDLNMDYCTYKILNNPFARDRVEDMILNLDLTDV